MGTGSGDFAVLREDRDVGMGQLGGKLGLNEKNQLWVWPSEAGYNPVTEFDAQPIGVPDLVGLQFDRWH